MTTTLEIVDLAEESRVQLVLTSGAAGLEDRETAPPAPFPFPLSRQEISEIEWFLTEYPGNPYGAAKGPGPVG